jgi:hypothetical protein
MASVRSNEELVVEICVFAGSRERTILVSLAQLMSTYDPKANMPE